MYLGIAFLGLKKLQYARMDVSGARSACTRYLRSNMVVGRVSQCKRVQIHLLNLPEIAYS